MFIKQLKYDLLFGRNTFFTMAAIVIGWGIIMGNLDTLLQDDHFFMGAMFAFGMTISMTVVGVLSIMQVFQLYRKSLFGDSGYLTLTLPVTRGSLLASKIAASMIWYLFMIFAGFIMVVIMVLQIEGAFIVTDSNNFFVNLLAFLLYIVFIGLFLISVLFFATTLAHSSFSNKRVHSVVSGIIGFVYIAVFFRIYNTLNQRSWGETLVEGVSSGGDVWSFTRMGPLIGIQYGRIPVGPETDAVFIDIYAHALTLAFAAAAIIATLYLLKKRIDLR
ncbi:MAG: hypothetical protein FWE20_00135 [Defluviitaleaceae bacterium]|nr:hypothetical protein [Defluviitaleaceae bacterium]